jgi:hypothetical protein
MSQMSNEYQEALLSPAGICLGADNDNFPQLIGSFCEGVLARIAPTVSVNRINGKDHGAEWFGYFISLVSPRTETQSCVSIRCTLLPGQQAFTVSSPSLDINNTITIVGNSTDDERLVYDYVAKAVKAAAFSESYAPISFTEAKHALESDKATAKRPHWKGFIFLVPGSKLKVNRHPLLSVFAEGTPIEYRPHVDRVFDDGTVGVYFPSDEDFSATDWIITVPEKIEPADGQIEMDF